MNAETLNRTTQRAAYSGKPVFKDFQPILDAHGINYHEGDVWLTVGGDAAPDGYLFFLSVRLLDIPKALDAVLPFFGLPISSTGLQGMNWRHPRLGIASTATTWMVR